MPETEKVISAIAPNDEFDKEPFWWIAANVEALANKGLYSTSLNDSTKVKLINKGSITFVCPFFANAVLCAVLIREVC
jgi:hypothetical protein